MLTAAPEKSLTPLCTMASNTGWVSLRDLLMTPRISAVVVCCSKRLGQIAGALAQLAEQPRVLDGDDGLGGEVLQQFDLLAGERPHLLPVDAEHADQLAILEHRNVDQRAGAAAFRDDDGRLLARKIGFVQPQIGNLQSLFGRRDARQRVVRRRGKQRLAAACLGEFRRRVVQRHRAERSAFVQRHDAEFRIADPRGIFEHGRKDRFQFARRRADDAQDVRRRRLLLQRLPQFAEQPRVLDGDHRLRGKIPHQCDLLVGKRLHLPPIDVDGADQRIVLEHWHGEQRADAGQFNAGDGERITPQVCRLRPQVGDMNHVL